MKIAIDARFYGYENGGLGRYTISFLNELAKLDTKNKYYLLLRKKYFNELVFPSNFEKVQVEARHYSIKEQILVPLALYKLRPDFVHFLHFNIPLLYLGKFVITIHDILMHEGVGRAATTLPYPIFKIKRLMYRIVFDTSIRRAVSILVPTKFVQKEVADIYPYSKGKIQVTYEGVEGFKIPKKELSTSKKTPYFLYVGNAYPHKNIPKAIEAIVYLNESLKCRAKLIIVTPRNVFRNRLDISIKKYKAQKYVILKSGLTNQQLAYHYKEAQAFVYPSLSEGFGLPALEGMSLGTPAVVSDIPVFHEVYKGMVQYFDPNNPVSIASLMQASLSSKRDARKSQSKKLIEFAKQYSWEKMTKEVLKEYNSL